jgi:predicted molibdopterin-dependent oxidoreductase YjgC
MKAGEDPMISLSINGQTINAVESDTVLEAAEKAGIIIPTLCHHKDLTPYGGCRLCVVEIQGNRLPSTSCNLTVSQGMVIQTESPALTDYRRSILKMLLRNFYDGGYKNTNGTNSPDEDSQFAHWVKVYGIDMRTAMSQHPFYAFDSDPNPYVWVDKNKCILCGRCVRACAEIQGRFVWEQAFRGNETEIVAGANTTMLQARCESCGACVAYCPTGALDNKMSMRLGKADRTVTTTCTYCSVGCQLNLELKHDNGKERIIRVVSDPDAPVNGMHLCVKGRFGYDFIQQDNRLLQPRVRNYLLEKSTRPKDRGPWVDVDWDTAIDIVAKQVINLKKAGGPESIGFLMAGNLVNEEYYLMNKLARQVIGTNNIDCSFNLVSSSTIARMGKPLVPISSARSFDDIVKNARSVFIIGSDITEQHPVLGAKIRQAILRRGVKLITAGVTFKNIDEYSSLRLHYREGTHSALINGLVHIIINKGWQDERLIKEDTEGFNLIKNFVKKFTPKFVAKETGIHSSDLLQAAETLALNRPLAILWGEGITGTDPESDSISGLVNLQLLLGDPEAPGGGMIPLRSQANSQGACDMGALPDFLPGYQPVMEQSSRKNYGSAWGTQLPASTGLTAEAMLSNHRMNGLKGLYIIGEGLISGEGNNFSQEVLHEMDFIVVQGLITAQAIHHADVFLPGVSFAEKTGTFTNAERRIQKVNQAIQPMGNAKPDWQIIMNIAKRILSMEKRSSLQGDHAKWNYRDTSQIMDEIAALVTIYSGISHKRIEQEKSRIWPLSNLPDKKSSAFPMSEFPRGSKRLLLWVKETERDSEK